MHFPNLSIVNFFGVFWVVFTLQRSYAAFPGIPRVARLRYYVKEIKIGMRLIPRGKRLNYYGLYIGIIDILILVVQFAV